MTKKWFGIAWGTRAESDAPMDRGSATPHQFMVDYWTFYEAYMQRKEHLVEATITAYSALAVVLLTRSIETWQRYGLWLVVFGFASSIIVEQFIHDEFRNWQSGVKLSIASQRVAADWLTKEKVAAAELAPVTSRDVPDVRMPQALATELALITFPILPEQFFKRWVHIACSGGPFARIAYRMMGLWWLAFLVRAWWTVTPQWWGLTDLWAQLS